MQNSSNLLSRAECNALRGIAIIGIVMHNFLHWLNPMVKENEYQFLHDNIHVFKQVLAQHDIYLPAHLISFFGHYGVPVFLFLSAYGLSRKYEQNDKPLPTAPRFVGYHYLKLFKMMIIGYVAFVLIDEMTPKAYQYPILNVVSMLGMFNNLLPQPDKVIWPGPFWFFGLMLQFYILFRLFLCRRHWGITVALIVVCWLLQLPCNPEGETMNRLRYNFIGGMLPFGLGLLYARYGRDLKTATYAVLTVVSAVLVFVMSFWFESWLWVPALVCVFCVSLVKTLEACPCMRWLVNHLCWVGSLSAALFVCHPVTRKILIPISRNDNIYAGLLLYIMASLCLAWLFRELMRRLPSPKMNNK